MRKLHWNDPGFSQIKGSLEDLWIKPEIILPGLWIVKGVSKGISQLLHRGCRGINRHFAILHLAEASHIIKPHNVIGVRMGEEGCVEPLDPLPKTLQSELGRCIDHEVFVSRFDQNGTPGSRVPRILREADGAITSDDGNPMRSSRSKKGEFK